MIMVSESKKIISHNFELEVHEDGYYLIRVFGAEEFTVDDLKTLVKGQRDLGARLMPALVLCSEQASTNIELLNILAKNVYNPYSTADAFVLRSMAQKILANFYIKINKPERPTRFFNDPENALIWLKNLMAPLT